MPTDAGARIAKFATTATLILLAACQPLQQKPESASAQPPAAVEQTPPATATCPPLPEPVTKKIFVKVPVDVQGKRVFGAVETLQLPALELNMDARIDTGAASSSLHARDITPFERDGKPWVRFTPGDDADAQPIELPIARFIRIKNKGEAESSRRPVVLLKVSIGPISQRLEMNLADRSNFDYPALIGRDFLKDVAIVDVSQKHIAVLPAPRIK